MPPDEEKPVTLLTQLKKIIYPRLPAREHSLYQRLNIIFGFFFLIPTFGLLYFLITYDLLNDKYIPIFFVAFLGCSLAGFITLRVVFEKIARLSKNLTHALEKDFKTNGIRKGEDEVDNISKSFTLFEKRLQRTFSQLERKVSDISILKELSDLCYVTFDPEELLYITLERGLKITNADIGSILIMENLPEKHFVVKASIGQGEQLTIGDTVDFHQSVAKYAVINKAPFVVEDIEKDSRLGRINKSQYASKSFVCMPIKTIRDIIGVMTIARKKDPTVFTSEDVEGLIPLVSNAAFTYENLRLLNEIEYATEKERYLAHLVSTVNSSMQDIELYQNLLKDTMRIVPLCGSVLLLMDNTVPDSVTVIDFYSKNKTALKRGQGFSCRGSILESMFTRADTTVVETLDPEKMTAPLEQELLLSHGGNAAVIHPLINSGKITGCFLFIHENEKDALQYKDLTHLVSNIFALAMEKSTLSTSARQRASELSTIKQIGSVLASSTFDIEQVLSYTMDMIRVAMQVEAGSLLLIEDNVLKVKTAFNVNMKELTDFSVQLGQGIAGHVAAKGDSIIDNNVQKSSMFFSAIDAATGFVTHSVLCVPMISQGRVIGVIEVLNKTNNNFVADDQQLLQSIASSVSIAIENSRLYKETLSIADQERAIRQIFQKFVPKAIVDKIVHGDVKSQMLMEEFKTVTLLNVDLRNFSRMAATIGPQKTVSTLNYFFSTMGEIVFSHQGIVDKYLGDGFLALFGAPLATISDADNAISAAIEMKEALVDINANLKEKLNLTLHTGISIHTGEVVVGNIGFDKKMDYTVIGDPVNSVFGIQELTKQSPDIILISEKTIKSLRYPVCVNEIEVPAGHSKVEGLKVFELISQNRQDAGYSL
ncbi:MAG: GAF domain-containing protein [Desulfotignum sp.]|nr:GAF domain-containing protein [Desulfotignum sp.]